MMVKTREFPSQLMLLFSYIDTILEFWTKKAGISANPLAFFWTEFSMRGVRIAEEKCKSFWDVNQIFVGIAFEFRSTVTAFHLINKFPKATRII